MEEKLGIDLVKDLAKVVVDIAEQTEKTLEDGQIQLTELVGFFDEGMSLMKLFSKKTAIMEQLKDIDSVERKELIEYIKAEYNSTNEKAEMVVAMVLDIIEELFIVYEDHIKGLILRTKELISVVKGKE